MALTTAQAACFCGPAERRHGDKDRGSALLATLCFAAVLSLSLGSYLAVCYRSLVLSNRTMHATHSIELAEIGMEEALWAMNNVGGFDGTWNHPHGTDAVKTFTGFTYDNGARGQVKVTVRNYTNILPPEVFAEGSITLSDGSIVTRTLQSTARRVPLFTKAIAAVGNVAFSFGGIVDSYNSNVGAYTATDPSHLTQANSAAVISAPDMNIGTAQIYGFAVTNPATIPDPTPFLYQSGAKLIGPGSGGTVDPGRRRTNHNLPVYAPTAPVGGSDLPPITSSLDINTSGVYRVDSISLTTDPVHTYMGEELRINVPDVVLVVRDSVQTSGLGQITIGPGGSLVLQIQESDGQGLVLEGSGIVNQTLSPQKLSVIVGGNYPGHPTSNVDVTNAFYGTIYLPNDTLTVANGSSIYGAMIAKDITFTGNSPAFHYDSALQDTTISYVDAPFALIQLRELSSSELVANGL